MLDQHPTFGNHQGFEQLTTETQTPIPEVHELMKCFITALQQLPPKPRYVYALELKLLHVLGLSPDSAQHEKSGLGKLLDDLTVREWDQIASLEVSSALARQLRPFLHGFRR